MSIVPRTPSTTGTASFLRVAARGAGGRACGASGAPAGGRSAVRLAVVAVAVGAMLASASSAVASTSVHAFSFSFGSGGSTPANPYPLSSPSSVAVDDASGAVYVADPGNDWVEKFDSSGNLVWIIGEGVDQTNPGNLCTVASGDTCQPGVAGTGPGQFTTPQFVAVDNSADSSAGDLYVGDTGDNVVQKFSPDGTLVSSWGDGGGATCGTANGQLSGACATGGPFTAIAGIAVDGPGNLNVLDPNSGNWFAFSPSGASQPTVNVFGGKASSGIGVDSAGNLYDVVNGGSLEQRDSSGNFVGNVTPNEPAGFAIDPSTSDVYADNGPNAIDHYDGSTLPNCVPQGGCVATQTLGSGHLTGVAGLAVNAVSGTVYAADQTAGDVAVFTAFPPGPPTVDRESASAVDSHEATLQAQINPHLLDTSCTLQYGTDTSYATGSAPCSPSDLGAGFTDVGASAYVSGLAPGTTYHYRFVATNSDSSADGPDQTFTTMSSPAPQSCPNAQFRTGPSDDLPDCRAWEQVSPVDKDGLDALEFLPTQSLRVRAATDGNKLMYESLNAYADPQGTALPDVYLATRSSTGWQTANVTPPTPSVGPDGDFTVDYEFSPDLSQAVYEVPDEPLAPGAAPNVANLFLRQSDGAFSLITTAPRSVGCPAGAPFLGAVCFEAISLTSFSGASSDYSHVIFQSNDCLTAEAPCGGVNNLYEDVGGHDSFVGILPDGTAAAGGSQAGSGDLPSLTAAGASDVVNAISADGSRIFFSAGADGGQPDPAQSGLTEVYERVSGSSTLEVSAPALGATPANSTAEPATYWGASADGSLVFFTSSAELTSDANTGSGNAGNAGNDLYEFNTSSGALTDLSVDTNAADASTGANVQGVVGASADGSYVYFVANGQLAPGEGIGGQPNLYLYHAGRVSFVATLSPNDASDWTNTTSNLQAYVTPDGQHLGLTSTMALTGYDNTDQNTGQPDSEVYEYSATGGQLACASCDPTGTAPVGNALIESEPEGHGTMSSPFYQPRVLSDDGSRLFFSSPDPLTPGAGSSYSKVYEYEHGTISLIDPATAGDDFFVDASASGNDVFIATRDPLVPSDQDQLVDVYDARVNGGFAAPASTPACQGDACQGTPTTPPPLPVAATVTFNGPANASSRAFPVTGKVRVVRRSVAGDAFVLTVRVPGNGMIALSGAWVTGMQRTVPRAGSYRTAVRLTPAGRRVLARRKRLAITVRVRFLPAAGAASTATARITLTALRHERRRTLTATLDTHQRAARRPR